jgi:hypothetical protein
MHQLGFLNPIFSSKRSKTSEKQTRHVSLRSNKTLKNPFQPTILVILSILSLICFHSLDKVAKLPEERPFDQLKTENQSHNLPSLFVNPQILQTSYPSLFSFLYFILSFSHTSPSLRLIEIFNGFWMIWSNSGFCLSC